MTIKFGKVSITEKQAKTIIKGAMAMVKDGLDSDPGLQGIIASDLLKAGLVSQKTYDNFCGE